MNYKHILAAVVFSLLLAFSVNVQAAASKIGVMNVQKVVTTCKAGKAAGVRFEAKMKEAQEKLKKDGQALEKLKAEIEKKKSVWSEEKTKKKIGEYQRQFRALQMEGQESRANLKKLHDQELQPILKALEKVVAEYGKKNGYTVILDVKAGVVYHDPSVRVTDDILKNLDKAMAK